MKMSEAYEVLELQPMDDYLFDAEEAETQLGATTSMLVAAALAIRQGLPVMLVMRNLRHGTQSQKKLLEFITKLNEAPNVRAVLPVPGQGNKSVRFTSGGSLLVSTENTMKNTDSDQFFVFRDVEWAMSYTARLKDPLDRVRYLLRKDTIPVTYEVRDSVWDFLFEVSEGGAAEIMNKDIMAIKLSDPPREATPFLNIWGR